MIKNRELAKEISDLMLDFSKRIDEEISRVQSQCPNEEFEIFRSAAGKLLGDILLEILNPLYKEHPELKPKELD